MSTTELNDIITEHLSQIEDESFLNAIKTIIESKISEEIYILSDDEKNRISIARKDLKERKTIFHEDVQNELNLCLNSK
ncbi:MAG TPA: hypothetical protein VLZ75_04145 [Chitinophagales bacterium]|nr:hypothetical protein [Chitinophagales bacterium]